ncbi:MAG: C-terminal binding protein [Bryobacterales bacterium]|nr:C-terminal binding protein [Bryobacterales bacterium]
MPTDGVKGFAASMTSGANGRALNLTADVLSSPFAGAPHVAVLDSAVVPDSADAVVEAQVLRGHCRLSRACVSSPEGAVRACADADGILLWHHVDLTAPVLRRLDRCRAIVRNGVGFDNVDIEECAALGIFVCNVPDYGTEEVADHALALALCLSRRVIPAAANVRSGKWDWRSAEPVRRSSTQTFGVLGLGRIGTAVALRARAFGFRVVFYDPHRPDGVDKALGLLRAPDFSSLLCQTDILSIHTPLTAETRHMVSAAALGQLPKGAVVVNTARGPIVDEGALAEALHQGHLAGAGLDVVEQEPSPDPRLLAHLNCIITPHSAFYSEESLREMREKSARTVLEILQHRPARNLVNRPVQPRAIFTEGVAV